MSDAKPNDVARADRRTGEGEAEPLLRVYVCSKFQPQWPVASTSVVVATNAKHAADLLNDKLRRMGIKGEATENMMDLVPCDTPKAMPIVFCVEA